MKCEIREKGGRAETEGPQWPNRGDIGDSAHARLSCHVDARLSSSPSTANIKARVASDCILHHLLLHPPQARSSVRDGFGAPFPLRPLSTPKRCTTVSVPTQPKAAGHAPLFPSIDMQASACRSRGGCRTCRQDHVKCDGAKTGSCVCPSAPRHLTKCNRTAAGVLAVREAAPNM